jgi:hypothetical protein
MLIDHVTIAGPSLAELEQDFANLGLKTDYGGLHSNGITHMALLGLADGSYIELISTLESGRRETVFWGEHIAGKGGPCAWAVRVDDIAAEAARIAALGIPVSGPAYYNRHRPDGLMVEWNLAFLGSQGAGAKLPFLIQDKTPRYWRVQPSASVKGWLTGVAQVILGVESLPEAINLFRRVYGWLQPPVMVNPVFGATLAHFATTPVILAAPLSAGNWLSARLTRFGESPCAYLLGSANFAEACQHYQLTPTTDWFGRRVAWFNLAEMSSQVLGLVEKMHDLA